MFSIASITAFLLLSSTSFQSATADTSTLTFYAVANGPTALLGPSPSISAIGGVGSNGPTTYAFDVAVSSIPVFDGGAGSVSSWVAIPETTLQGTVVADATRAVISYSSPLPQSTPTSPVYPNFVQDCKYSSPADGSSAPSQGDCTWSQVGFTPEGGTNQAIQQFGGQLVPEFSAVVDTDVTQGAASATTNSPTMTKKDVATMIHNIGSGGVVKIEDGTATTVITASSSSNNRNGAGIGASLSAIGASAVVAVMSGVLLLL